MSPWTAPRQSRANNSTRKAFIARADTPAEAERLVRAHCRLSSVDGILVVIDAVKQESRKTIDLIRRR
jgi:hypothetical protein